MQPIRELDQQHADILAHGKDKFAEILSLFGAFRLQFKPRQLGVTQMRIRPRRLTFQIKSILR
jgi:hypothetical protein